MAGKKKHSPKKNRPNRNALCPCGSGRAFKNCCANKRIAADKPESLPNQFRRIFIGSLIGIVVAALLGFAIVRPWEKEETSENSGRYWHAGHGHWHDGPAPVDAQPTIPVAPSSAPQPWEYNAVANQHWHPGHAHWHDGPPPPPGERTY